MSIKLFYKKNKTLFLQATSWPNFSTFPTNVKTVQTFSKSFSGSLPEKIRKSSYKLIIIFTFLTVVVVWLCRSQMDGNTATAVKNGKYYDRLLQQTSKQCKFAPNLFPEHFRRRSGKSSIVIRSEYLAFWQLWWCGFAVGKWMVTPPLLSKMVNIMIQVMIGLLDE